MKKLIYLTLLLNLLFLSCSDSDDKNDNCGIVCSAPNRILKFDLIDKSTQKNIFVSNIYKPNLLEVLNSNNDKVEFQFIDIDDYIIAINLITSNANTESYIFKITDKIVFKLEVETKSNNDECCPFIIYSKVDISDAEFSRNSTNGTYEIIVK